MSAVRSRMLLSIYINISLMRGFVIVPFKKLVYFEGKLGRNGAALLAVTAVNDKSSRFPWQVALLWVITLGSYRGCFLVPPPRRHLPIQPHIVAFSSTSWTGGRIQITTLWMEFALHNSSPEACFVTEHWLNKYSYAYKRGEICYSTLQLFFH